MGRTILQISARQSEEAPSQPGVGEEGGAGHMEHKANTTQQSHPMLRSSPSWALHNWGTHTGHPLRLADKLGTDQVSRAISAYLRPFRFRHGLDPRTAGRRQCSPFLSLLILKEGSQDASGRVRVTPPTTLLLHLFPY